MTPSSRSNGHPVDLNPMEFIEQNGTSASGQPGTGSASAANNPAAAAAAAAASAVASAVAAGGKDRRHLNGQSVRQHPYPRT